MISARKFAWLPRFSDAMTEMSKDEKKDYCLAMVEYGAYGIEPNPDKLTPYALGFVRSQKNDIDNYLKRVEEGRKGGQAGSKKRESEPPL